MPCWLPSAFVLLECYDFASLISVSNSHVKGYYCLRLHERVGDRLLYFSLWRSHRNREIIRGACNTGKIYLNDYFMELFDEETARRIKRRVMQSTECQWPQHVVETCPGFWIQHNATWHTEKRARQRRRKVASLLLCIEHRAHVWYSHRQTLCLVARNRRAYRFKLMNNSKRSLPASFVSF